MYIILEGSKNTIAGIIAIVDSMNQQSHFDFTYSCPEDGKSITINAKEPEHFYSLGGACALFLKETLKVVANQLLEK